MSPRTSQPGSPACLSVEDHDRLNTFMPEIAAAERNAPVSADRRGYRIGNHGSLWIGQAGNYADFEAGVAAPGATGRGALQLIMHLKGCDWSAAVAYAVKWLSEHEGFGRLEIGDDESDQCAEEDAARQVTIETMWEGAEPGKGIACLIAYLKSRGITVSEEDWTEIHWIERARGDEAAMLVRSTHPDGLMATQETYITADGKKSPHEPARRTARGVHDWRRYGLVRLGHQTADHAFICEGTEDGLSVRMAGGELVLVTWGVGAIGEAKLPADVKTVTIVRHPERRGDPGDKALWRGGVRLLGKVRTSSLRRARRRSFHPSPGNPMKDANDVLQAHGVEGVKRLLDSAMPVADLDAEVDSETVVEAASFLPRGHYENARSTVAKAVGWRVTALDKARDEQIKERRREAKAQGPATDPADTRRYASPHVEQQILSEILDDIKALIVRHIHLQEWIADLLAIFAAYTHCYQLFEFAVRIRFFSADPESGKTTTMMLTLRCCQNWRRTDDITGANLSRAFNKPGGCTMGIDEDTSMQGRALVIALLRAGFDREGQRDLMEKDAEGNMSEASYNLFGPVLLTGLDPLDPALQSRCIMVEMMPPLPPDVARGEKKKPKITMRTKRLCAEFASRLARYTQDNLPRLQELITEVEEANENEVETDIIPAEIDNRTEDKLTPLFVLAYAAGPAWRQRMEDAWRMMNPAKTREELRPGVQLLLDLRDLFARDGRARWSTAELISALSQGEDGTGDTIWAEMPALREGTLGGKALTQTQLAFLLRKYGIRKRRVRDGSSANDAPRGRYYFPADFGDVFARNLTPGRTGEGDQPEPPNGANTSSQAEEPRKRHNGDGADDEPAERI